MKKVIKNSLDETIDYTFVSGDSEKSDWIILLGHGVTGNKDRPIITDTADALNKAGYNTLRFSFSGNGNSDGDFQNATISKEVGDLEMVIEYVSQSYSNIIYIGHSMGGAVGVIQASKDARISALISLAGMVDTKAFAKAEFGDEVPDQSFMWGESDCPLSSKFMHDLCVTIQSVEPLAAAISAPWLLAHGTADDVVLPRDTESIQKLKGSAVDTVFIDGADHSFDQTPHKQQLTQTIVNWINQLTK